MEKRRSKDRRKKPTNPLSVASLFGRRRRIRRREDQKEHYYVDRYGATSITLLLLVLILCVTDAFLTLRLVASGASEFNPFMDFFLGLGVKPFLLIKYCLTGLGTLFLIVHKEYRFFHGRVRGLHLVAAIVVFYLVLVCWEVVLLSRVW